METKLRRLLEYHLLTDGRHIYLEVPLAALSTC